MAENDPAQNGNNANNETLPGAAVAFVPGGDLPAGHVVGEYRIDAVVGRGGMGVVYAATQPVIEKRVAIKVLNGQYSSDPALVRRFTDEARAVNRIRHPNIIDIFSFGQLGDGRQYFVMEFLEGATLGARLEANTLSMEEMPLFLGQICDALDAAHAENIVHRDLKPENIWLSTPRRGRPFVKLLDFGIAKLMAVAGQSSTQTGAVMGTPHYMSPEQCHGRAVDHRTDIYAMGVILYRLYAGRLPFEGETFMEVLTKQVTLPPDPPSKYAAVAPPLDKLILRCLAKEPAERPQTAGELGKALEAIFSTASASLAPSTPTPPLGSMTTLGSGAAELQAPAPPTAPVKGRGLWIAGVVLAAGAIAVIVAAVATHHSPAGAPEPVIATPASGTAAPPPAPAAPAPPPAEAAKPAEPSPAPPAETPPASTAAAATKKHHPGTAKPSSVEAPAPRPTRAHDTGLVRENPFQ